MPPTLNPATFHGIKNYWNTFNWHITMYNLIILNVYFWIHILRILNFTWSKSLVITFICFYCCPQTENRSLDTHTQLYLPTALKPGLNLSCSTSCGNSKRHAPCRDKESVTERAECVLLLTHKHLLLLDFFPQRWFQLRCSVEDSTSLVT